MYKEFEPLSVKPRKVIIDTDIGPDCDDAGAIAILCLAAQKYGFEIAAAVNCTSNPFGDGCTDAIVRFAGTDGVRLGRFMSREFLSEHRSYNEPVAKTYSAGFRNGNLRVENSADVYRDVLSGSEDDGVVVITIGQMNAFAEIVSAEPELCAKKLHCLVSMAGSRTETMAEYNIVCDAAAAETVFSKLEAPIILSPFEVGASVVTGFSKDDEGRDPVRDSYRYYTKAAMRRNSWDLTAVQFAVEGCGKFYGLSETYRVKVLENGCFSMDRSPDGKVRFMEKKTSDRELEKYIDGLLSSVGR